MNGATVTTTTAQPPLVEDVPADGCEPEQVKLPVTVRLKDGREATVERTPEWHREVHLSYLHAMSRGFIEVAAGRRNEEDGKLDIYTRRRRDYFVPAGGPSEPDWRIAALELAERHLQAGEELFLGVAPRAQLRGGKPAVQWSRWLWLDLDGPEHLGRLEALLESKPAHLLIESAGSGGMHAYWRLTRRLDASKIRCEDGRIMLAASRLVSRQ